MWRSIASNAITFFVVGLFILGGLILWGRGQYDAPGPLTQAICLQVEPGSNFRRVSERLETQSAISSGLIFRTGVEYSDKAGDLKAGSFLVPPAASMQEIVDIVTRGGASTCGTEIVFRIGVARMSTQVREMDPEQNRFVEVLAFDPAEEDVPSDYIAVRDAADTRFRVAFAEGVTSWQITDALGRIGILTGEVAEVPPEGALAPNSYEVARGQDRNEILTQMRAQQEIWVAQAWAARQPDLPLTSPLELLTLASIIEKETSQPDERGLVSGVFVNRLNRGMRLQTDPTVIYGITQGQGILGRGLRRSELRAATPWNTYVIEGLPPTPIANPGLDSLMAAAQPEQTGYIFFVADGTGGHAFAETLEEHNRNVAVWREIEAQRREQQDDG